MYPSSGRVTWFMRLLLMQYSNNNDNTNNNCNTGRRIDNINATVRIVQRLQAMLQKALLRRVFGGLGGLLGCLAPNQACYGVDEAVAQAAFQNSSYIYY